MRESLFNLLAHGDYGDPPPPEGRRVLDLFAGTGALGLEALSRGAAPATFVDQGSEALALLRRNLARLGGRASAARVIAATRPGSGATLAPPSTSSSSTRPTAAASASGRSPRRSPAAGWRPGALVVWEEGVNQTTAARLDPARRAAAMARR